MKAKIKIEKVSNGYIISNEEINVRSIVKMLLILIIYQGKLYIELMMIYQNNAFLNLHNPLLKSGCVKPRTCILKYTVMLVVMAMPL